jgi:hypothetical protein
MCIWCGEKRREIAKYAPKPFQYMLCSDCQRHFIRHVHDTASHCEMTLPEAEQHEWLRILSGAASFEKQHPITDYTKLKMKDEYVPAAWAEALSPATGMAMIVDSRTLRPSHGITIEQAKHAYVETGDFLQLLKDLDRALGISPDRT